MRLKLFISLLTTLLVGPIRAQEPLIYHITENQGLPSILVYDLFVDSKGKLWLGTEEGIFWYDGFEFHGFSLPNARSTAVSGITETNSGNLLFRNFSSQVFMLEKDSVTAFQLNTPKGLICEFNEFTQSSKGVIYFQKDTVIYSVRDPTNETASIAWDQSIENIPLRWLNFIINDTFFFSEKHIVDLGEQKVLVNPYKTRATGYYKKDLLHYDYVNSEYIYLGEHDSLFLFQDKRKTTVNHVFHESDSSVWICTRDGVSNIKNGRYTTWFSGQFVTDMISDSDGNYWISTLNSGIYKVPKHGLTWLKGNQNELLHQHISYVNHSEDSSFYVGTNSGKLFKANDSGQSQLLFDSKFKEPIKQVLSTPFGQVVVGNSFYFLNNHFEVIQQAVNAAKKIALISDSLCLYAAGAECGYYNLRNQTRTVHKFRRGRTVLAHRGIHYIAYDDSLMYRSNSGPWQSVRGPKGSIVASALLGIGDTVWIASLSQGVLALVNNTIHEIIDQDAIARGLNMKAWGDKLLISTSKGLYSYSTKNHSLVNISKQLGLPLGAVYDFEHYDSLLLIASRKGVLMCDLKRLKNNDPHKNIERISLATDWRESYPSQTDQIHLNFQYWSYHNSDFDKLYYRLNGGSWKVNDLFPTSLSFNAPSPGSYTIDLAIGNELQAFRIWHTGSFTILSPFYARWWFRAMAVLLPFVLLFWFFIIRFRRQREQNMQQLRISTAELDKQRSMLTALRSQMNPHFLFNALNSIQDFILRNQKDDANRYLGKFADLIRNTLSLSSQDLVRLSDEIHALENYLELEALRFEKDLQWKIEIDPTIDTSYFRVPPLLIQPFIENALKHGLMHLEGPKNLELRITNNAHGLTLEIEDNGIGIEASKLKNEGTKQHSSFALKASQSRISLLNNVYGGKIILQIISPVNGKKGTLVRIELPILHDL